MWNKASGGAWRVRKITRRKKKAIARIPNRLPVEQRVMLMSASPVPAGRRSWRLAEPETKAATNLVASDKPEDEGEYGAGDSNEDGAIVW
jgi:predicted metalloprotease